MPRKSPTGIDGVSITAVAKTTKGTHRPWLCRVRVPHTLRYLAKCFDSRSAALEWALETRQSFDTPLMVAQSAYINAVQVHYGERLPTWVQQRIIERSESMFRSVDLTIRLWQKDAPLKSGRSVKRMARGQKKRMEMAAELCS